MAVKTYKVLYLGADEAFFEELKGLFSTEPIFLENFFEEGLSFSDLSKKGYAVVVVDGDYKTPLTFIETIRTLYPDYPKPYIMLVGRLEQIKVLKNQINVRNYPDDICLKEVNKKCIVNQILFGCNNELYNRDILCNNEFLQKGDLKDRGYGSILFDFFKERFTGRLLIDSLSDKAVFSFLNGEPIDIKFNRIQFTLGRLLLRKGIIDEETYLKSLEYMNEKNIRHGDALVEMGAVSSSTIVEMIEEQYKEKLLYFFSKTSGTYIIIPSDVDYLVHPKIDFFNILYLGVMRYSQNKYLTDKFLKYKNSFVALTENFSLYSNQIPFNEEERGLLNIFQSAPTVVEALEKTTMELSQALRVLEILYTCQMVAFKDSKEEALLMSKWAEPKMMEIKERIINVYRNLKEKNYYQILDLSSDCSESDIKKHYLEKVKEYHPDRYSHLGLPKELMDKVNETFQLIQIAYQTLSNPETRKNYDAILSSKVVSDTMKKSSDIINAEISFKKGEFLLKRRNYRDAEGYLRKAVELYDKEPEYLTALAYTLMFVNKDDNEKKYHEVKELLEKAIYINPYYDRAYQYLGIMHKLLGRPKEAQLYFKKAVEINPANKEALLELKSIE